MHILLTDILSCPGCGPQFGLILLADRVEDRRVIEGTLGCANCDGRYPVHGGLADLRIPVEQGTAASEAVARVEEDAGVDTAQRALRWAALMGVAEGPGYLLVVGPAAALADGIAALVDNLEVIAASPASAGLAEQPGVSRIMVSTKLPFYSGKVRAVALSGTAASRLLEEGARAVGPLGRLVLEPAPEAVDERLANVGMRIVAKQDHTVVAARM